MKAMIRRILKEMQIKDWGQSELANKARVSQSTINRLLNENANSRIDTVYKVAKALEVPVEYLIVEDEQKALLCLQISKMNRDELQETLSHIEKEQLYKERKKLSS
jgi:transcriptional regulator with XRE-family HTH domain